MPENTATKLLPERKIKKTKVQIDSSQSNQDFLGSGVEASVHRVGIKLGERSVPQGLAYKEYGIGSNAEHAIVAWRELKSAGAPVPQTFRIVGESGKYTGILMTDLTNGWRDILLTSNSTKIHVIDNVMQFSPQTVQKLAETDLPSAIREQKIEEQFQEMALKMAHAGIEITHADVVSIVFTENGEIHPIISDMKNVNYGSKKSVEELEHINRQRLQSSFLWLNEGHRIARETFELHKRQ